MNSSYNRPLEAMHDDHLAEKAIVSLDISRIRGLCFDIDGTLSDTDDQFVVGLARFLKPLRPLLKGTDENKIARRLVMAVEAPGNWLISIPDRMGIDDQLVLAANFFARHNPGPMLTKYLLIAGVIEMLEALQSCFPMSIVSARGQRTSLRFLEAFELQRFFSVIATAQTCRHTKPFPDPVYWAAAEMGVPATNCLMIGDTVVDIRAGKAAGAQTVGVLCGFGTAAELGKAGADLILDSTAELANVLGN